MKRLLKLNLRNIYHNKLFYVCTGILLLLSAIFDYVFSIGSKSNTEQVLPEIASFLSSEVGLVASIFIALFCCLDFSEGTTKNIIARGYTRAELMISKYLASIIGIFSMYGIVMIAYFLLFFRNGIGYNFDLVYPLINSVIGIIAYTVFYATMSILLEKNGSAIIACLIIPNIIPAVLSLIDAKLKLGIGDYWMDSASRTFNNNPTLNNLGWSILYYVVYIIIFIIIGIKLFNKKEIK